jgi:hypothetical protein
MGWSSEVGVQVEFAPGGFEETARPEGGNTPRRSVDLRLGSTAWWVDRATRGPEVELVARAPAARIAAREPSKHPDKAAAKRQIG